MATRSLQRVDRLADACFVRWRLQNGSLADQEITQAQYRALKGGDSSTLTPPARNATLDLGNGTGACWAEYRVTGNRRPQAGDVFPLVYGPEIFSLEAGSGYTHALVLSSRSCVLLKPEDTSGDLNDPRALTVTRTLRDAQVVDGQLIEPD